MLTILYMLILITLRHKSSKGFFLALMLNIQHHPVISKRITGSKKSARIVLSPVKT